MYRHCCRRLSFAFCFRDPMPQGCLQPTDTGTVFPVSYCWAIAQQCQARSTSSTTLLEVGRLKRASELLAVPCKVCNGGILRMLPRRFGQGEQVPCDASFPCAAQGLRMSDPGPGQLLWRWDGTCCERMPALLRQVQTAKARYGIFGGRELRSGFSRCSRATA